MSYFRSFFGPGGEAEKETGDEVVEKLVLRLECASSIEDRRDALKALRSMSKSCRLSVATLGLNYYIEILATETDVKELVGLTLEILSECLSSDDETIEHDELGSQLAAMLLNKPDFLNAMFRILEIPDFLVRRNAVQLMTTLVRLCHKEVQDAVIAQPMAVSKIVDLLHENREVIRNNVVLLLTELARGDTALQKLLAYQNTFQLLFDIIDQETADSIVVEDCLFVILNLLKRNSSNQEYFREASLVQRLTELARMFLCPPEDSPEFSGTEWPEQKTSNFIFILEIVRSLVSPVDNIHSTIHAAQKVFMQCKMLDLLSMVLMNDFGVSVEVLSESIVTVSEIIRGNYSCQDFFAHSSLNETHRSSLLVLLKAMTADKQHFRVRSSVFYCFISFLFGNLNRKTQTVESLLPSDNQEEESYAIGQHICLAILSTESVQVWFGACILMHCLIDADDLKTQLLRVQLSVNDSECPSSLLTHISRQLINLGPRKLQVRCGLLMLLSTWLHNCNLAIDAFLSTEENLHFLTTEMMDHGSYDVNEGENQLVRGLIAFLLAICINDWKPENPEKKTAFTQLIDRRVGRERLAEALDSFSRSEFYIHAAQRPQPLAKNPQELKLEYQFTKLFKHLEADLLKTLRPNGDLQSTKVSETVVTSYKKLIKQQDDTIAALTQELAALKTTGGIKTEQNGILSQNDHVLESQYHQQIESLKAELAAKDARIVELSDAYIWVEQARAMNEKWQAEVATLQGWLLQWQNFHIEQLQNPYDTYCQQLTVECRNYESQLAQGYAAYEQITNQFAAQTKELEHCKNQIADLQRQLMYLQKPQQFSPEKQATTGDEKYEKLFKEHDDLLLLLAEQDTKMKHYKQRLKEHGEAVSDNETDA
jgi:hypothetical protein